MMGEIILNSNEAMAATSLTEISTARSNMQSYSRLNWINQCFDAAQSHRMTLFGRDDEIAHIYEAYDNVKTSKTNSQLVLVSGATGVGKTGLARSMQYQVEGQGYFVVGKFDQLQRPEPHTALVEAITQLISKIIECGDAQKLRDNLAVHGIDYIHGGNDLMEMIPSLKSILPPKPSDDSKYEQQSGTLISSTLATTLPVCGLSTNRWKDLLRLFLRAASSPQKPVVLLIEDLHWADENSIDLILTLLQDNGNCGSLFICTYRTENESKSTSLERIVKEFKQSDTHIKHFALKNVSHCVIAKMVANLLSVEINRADQLASLLHKWTKGNMLLVWKYIHTLRFKNLLYVDEDTGHWQWDNEEIEIEIQTIKDVLKYKIGLLPEISQENLKMTACLGSRLDRNIMLRLFSANEVAVSVFIDDAAKAHLIFFDNVRGAWCFSHDYIQEKIYHLIPVEERNHYHYQIGRKLWKEFDLDELGKFLPLVVGQLLLGVECIKDCRERIAVAKLCLGAGVRAVQLSNFQSSYKYLKSGINLLNESSWVDEYDLTINLHNAAAEVANSLGLFTEVHALIDKSLLHSKTHEDSHRAQATRVHALGRNGQLEEAVNLAVKILDKLGEKISTHQGPLWTSLELSYLRWRLRGETKDMIMRLPIMTDSKKLAAMEMMNLIFLYTSLVKPELTPILGCRMVRLSLNHGLSVFSCIGFAVFAVAVAGLGESFKEADRLGMIGFSLLQKFDAKPWLARISSIYYDRVFSWVRPFGNCRLPLKEAYNVGLQFGDTELAVCCAIYPLLIEFEIRPIAAMERDFEFLLDRISLYGLRSFEKLSRPIRHLMKDLAGSYDGNLEAIKKMIADDESIYVVEASNVLIKWKYVHRALQFFLFGQYEDAMNHARVADSVVVAFYGPHRGSSAALICGLADVAHARHKNCKRALYAKKYSKMLLRWATNGEPRNFLGKHYFLEAELAALAGKKTLSYKLYVSAIGTCREGKFLISTAMACERTAQSLLEWGQQELAGPYFHEAAALYTEWGATKKAQHLQLQMIELGF